MFHLKNLLMCKKIFYSWKKGTVEKGKSYRLGTVVQTLGYPVNKNRSVHISKLRFFSTGEVTEIDQVAKKATLKGVELVPNGHKGSYKTGDKEFCYVLPLP
jgi:hypothetical protein